MAAPHQSNQGIADGSPRLRFVQELLAERLSTPDSTDEDKRAESQFAYDRVSWPASQVQYVDKNVSLPI